jgi:molybdopterin converting factor small subunit
MKYLKVKVNYVTSRVKEQLSAPDTEVFHLPEGSTYEDFLNVFSEKHDLKETDIGVFSQGQNILLKLKEPISNLTIDVIPLISGG